MLQHRVRLRAVDDHREADEEQNQVCGDRRDRKSTRLNSSHLVISYAVFCLKKKNHKQPYIRPSTYLCYLTIRPSYGKAVSLAPVCCRYPSAYCRSALVMYEAARCHQPPLQP